MTFEPVFVDSDSMYYSKRELNTTRSSLDTARTQNKEPSSNGDGKAAAVEIDSVQASKNLFKTQHALQGRSQKSSLENVDETRGPVKKKVKFASSTPQSDQSSS